MLRVREQHRWRDDGDVTTRRTGPSVLDVAVHQPKVLPPDASIADVRTLLTDTHVHAALLTDGPTLLAVIERVDLLAPRPDDEPALRCGALDGRTVDVAADAHLALEWMRRHRRRRLAVVDDELALHGLLCLKASESGFCRDADVAARAAERAAWAAERALDQRLTPDLWARQASPADRPAG